MTAAPTVALSVLIPARDAARFLPESLEGILAQTTDADEIIVVDDGPDGGLAGVLTAAHPRVRVIPGPRRGLAAVRNAALAVARGQWIAFHDADDVAAPDRLALLRAALAAHPGSDGVFANGEHLLHPGVGLVPAAMAARLDGHRLRPTDVFLGFPVYLQGALVARTAFERAGAFDESLPVQPDLEYGYRLFATARIHFLDRIAFQWREHAANMSRDRLGTRRDIAQTLEGILRDRPEIVREIGEGRLCRRLARHWFRLARTYHGRGAGADARRAAARAAALAPWNVRYQLLSRWRLA